MMGPRHRSRRLAARGFTLLEVMVAVAILGLGLTAILSAQISAVSASAHARHMSVATGLARCKMSEVEERLRREGYPEIDFHDEGPCCEGDETRNIRCTWNVQRPIFPDAEFGKLDLDASLDGTALGKLSGGAEGEGAVTGGDIGEVAQSLAGDGDVGAALAGGIGGVASMVMGIVYPDLKRIFEASARRITVVLTWTEGTRSYEIELVQWVAQPQPGTIPSDEDEDGGGATPTGPTAPSKGSGR